MRDLDTLARRSAAHLQATAEAAQVPRLGVGRVRAIKALRVARLVALAVVVAAVPLVIGAITDEEPVAPPTTIPAPETTVPSGETEGELRVETSLGTWVWTFVDDHNAFPGFPDSETPTVEMPDPPLPAIEGLIWPQFQGDLGGVDWQRGRPQGHPASFGDVTITMSGVVGFIDWNRYYTYQDGWVEGRWLELDDDDCPWVEVCPVQGGTLEILAVRDVRQGGGTYYPVEYPVEGVLDVLEATVIPGDPGAVEFRDQETGELVLRLEADDRVSAEHLLRAGQFCVGGLQCAGGMPLPILYVDDVGWVDPPWGRVPGIPWPSGWWMRTVGVNDDGFWVVGFGGYRSSRTLHVWVSSDGVTWDELAPPLHLGELLDWGLQEFDLVGDDLAIINPASDPDGPRSAPLVLRLVEGSGWEEVGVDLSAIGPARGLHGLHRTSWGWMATWDGRCEVWISEDGTTWEAITRPSGSMTGPIVHLHRWRPMDDGSFVAENPVPTQSETISAFVTASQCRVVDDHMVSLNFEHIVRGTGPAGEDLPDFFYTTWLGGFESSPDAD
jgi:hypothetical protein